MRKLSYAAAAAATILIVQPAAAMQAYRVKSPTIGCIDPDLVQRLRHLRQENGQPAADAMAQDALDTGECTPLPAGMLVVEVDNDIVGGMTKVRAPGAPAAVWVRYAVLSDED